MSFVTQYLETLGVETFHHDEDLIEEVTRDYTDFRNEKKLKKRLDIFAKNVYTHYFRKRHKLKEVYKGGIPRYLYHATFGPLVSSILERGIIPGGTEYENFPGSERGVYMAADKAIAISFMEVGENEKIPEEWLGDIVILVIDLYKLDNKKLFEKDPHWNPSVGCREKSPKSFLYRGIVPTSAIIKVEDEHGNTIYI